MKKVFTITTITALLVLLGVVVMIDGFGQGPKQAIDQTSETRVSETIIELGEEAPTKNPSQLKTGEELQTDQNQLIPNFILVDSLGNCEDCQTYRIGARSSYQLPKIGTFSIGNVGQELIYNLDLSQWSTSIFEITLPDGYYDIVLSAEGYKDHASKNSFFGINEFDTKIESFEFVLEPTKGDVEGVSQVVTLSPKNDEIVLTGFVYQQNHEPAAGFVIEHEDYKHNLYTTTVGGDGFYELRIPYDENLGSIKLDIMGVFPNNFKEKIFDIWSGPPGVQHKSPLILDKLPGELNTVEMNAYPIQRMSVHSLKSGSLCDPTTIIRVGTNCSGNQFSCTSVISIPLEVYVRNVLSQEWVPGWSPHVNSGESFKTGAVAIRSYAIYHSDNPLTSSYDLCNTTYCQVYSPAHDAGNSATNPSVLATQGWLLTDGNGNSRKSEFAAETNDNPNNPSGCTYPYWGECGDGYFQRSVVGPPCNNGGCYPNNGTVDYVSLGYFHSGSHPRACSQRGSFRWATGIDVNQNNTVLTSSVLLPATHNGINYCVKNWQQILLHYYPYYTLENCLSGVTIDYNTLHPTGKHECGSVSVCSDVYEPNNTVANAAVVDLVGSGAPWSFDIDACVSGTSDNDWYEILLLEPGLLTVTLSEPAPLQLDLASQPSVAVTTLSNGNKRLTFCHGGLMCYPLRIKVWDPGILGSANSEYTLSFGWNPLLSCVPDNLTMVPSTPKLGSTGLTLSNISTSCSGYMITAQVSGGSGTYDWYIDGIWKGGSSLLHASAGSSGFHSILVIDRNNPCLTAWDDVTISSGTANPSISPSAPSITNGGSVQLFASGGSSYSWSPSTGLSNSHIWNPIASPSVTTTYTVSVTDAGGCVSTRSVVVTVTGTTVSVPSNNTPCSAQTLSVGVNSCSYTTGTNVGATNSGVVVSPLCGSTSLSGNTTGNYSGGDVWYKVLVPSSGMVIIQTQQQSSLNDAVIAAYTGSCGNLTMIACADDQSSTNFMPMMTLTNLSPNTWVYIRVWEFGNNVFGAFGICATTVGSGGGNTSGPDLTVTSFSVNDHTVDQGDIVTVSFSIKNNGNQMSPACWYTCGLANSFTATLVTGGLMNFAAIPSLAPGITYSLSLNFTIPNVNDGIYYLVIGADEPLDNVAETNENNNLGGEIVTVGDITPQGVDLDVTTRYLSQTSGLQPGLAWEIGIEVENDGTEDAIGTNALIALSTNTTYEPGIDIVLWQFNTANLDPGEGDYDEKWITFPPVPHAGTWRVLFIADVNHQIQELDESNNIETRTITVATTTPATADYVTAINYLHDKTTGQNLMNNQIPALHELEIFTGTTNQGLIRPNVAARTNFIVSPLPYLVGMQARIGTNTHSSAGIAVGGTDNASPDEFLTGVQVGINYIIVRTDYRQELYEGAVGENNNFLVYPFEITHSGPVADLVPQIISMAPYSNALGDSIVVTTRVYNYGDTTAYDFLLRHWVSIDDQFDGREIDGRLEQTLVGVDSLAPGDSIDVVRHMAIDNDFDAPDLISTIGQYYVLAVVDEECEDVIESSVLNNVSSIPIYIHDISCYVNMKWHYDEPIDTVEWDETHLDWIYFESPEDCEYTITSSPWITMPFTMTLSGATVEYPAFPENLTGIDRVGCIYADDKDSLCFVQKAAPSEVLPVTWISIDAYEFEGNGLVFWQVGVEYNVSYYSVERSFDGINFHEIGTVAPFNQPNSVYRFSDELHDHTVYYRVIAVDHDGAEDTSDVVSLVGYRPYEKGTYTLIQYDNRYQLESFGPIRYQVYSMLGQTMQSSECNPGETCDIQMEQAGMYMLVITLYDEYYVEKIIF